MTTINPNVQPNAVSTNNLTLTSKDPNSTANLMAEATGNNPIAAGQALRQLDSQLGGRANTNAAIQDTRVTQLPSQQGIDCADIPANLPTVAASLDVGLHVGIGGTASVGRFTSADLGNGKFYQGFYATAGVGVGLNIGGGATASGTTSSNLPGTSLQAGLSVPAASVSTSLGQTDGNAQVNSIGAGPGAKVGAALDLTHTSLGFCSVSNVPFSQ